MSIKSFIGCLNSSLKSIMGDLIDNIKTIEGSSLDQSSSGPPDCLNTNTVAWYIASETGTITKDGSNYVSRWNDYLASGHDLIQATGTKQPLWSADGILFDGVDNLMQTATFTLNKPTFIYTVLKQVTWTLNDYLWDGFNQYGMVVAQQATTPGLKAYAGTSSSQNDNLAVNTFAIIRALFNGASSKLQVNVTVATTGDFGSNDPGGITLGSYASEVTNFSNIQVKEFIARNVADNETDETAIYNYLASKYSIS